MQKIDFCRDWSFGKADSRERKRITLPHDAMLEEERLADNPSGAGGAYFSGGAYQYEKIFEVPVEWRQKKVVLQFEGIYQTAVIYLNHQEIGKVYNGYSTTEIVADPFLNYGGQNLIQVSVDNQNQPNSRWYSGAGIYRPVWIYLTEKEGIALHGVKIRTMSCNPAQIEVTVSAGKGTPVITITDGEKEVARVSGNCAAIDIPDAKLWSDESPNLYTCHVELHEDGVDDVWEENFGIRKTEWSTEGLFVNGKKTLLRGGCVHHDNGLLGACGYEEAEWRKVRIMKEAGFNAIRSSHNPCSRAMLDACDAMGMYMLDETWDMWYRHKTKYDYAEFFQDNYRADLQAMVDKDFNHPSVIFYSIGNEVSEPASQEGLAVEKEMVSLLHDLDPDKAVTAGFNLTIIANAAKGSQLYDGEGGMNTGEAENMEMPKMDSAMFNQLAQQIGFGMNHAADSDEADAAITPAIELLDIAGYNYASGRYPLEGEKHPDRILFGSETFPQDIGHNWELVEKYPYIFGDFMWTAWDYLGEAGIGAWSDFPDAMGFGNPYPWLLGGAGVIDLLGDPDGQALYAKTVWGLSEVPQIAVRPVNMSDAKTNRSIWRGTNAIPSWSWRGCEGNQALVEIYAEGAEAELRINGKIVERKTLEMKKACFETVYEAGEIEAVAYDHDGRELSRNRLTSAREKLHIGIVPETAAVSGKLLYVNVNICDDAGIIECNADEKLQISVDGGELLAFGSAIPRTEESYLTGTFTTYRGRSQAVIRVGKDEELKICITTEEKQTEVSFPVKKEI
ncbi:MAG: DUF4982 domain-containing protein [Lachnospiraceae bacterium]|nr:DUF4982 domain-containing protein [Lachnospiraceae bacterium]